MSDVETEILRVELPVRAASRQVVGVEARAVAFLRVADAASGRVGFGECAPLPGLHRERLDEAIGALEGWTDGTLALEELPPSAAFAASTACAMLDGFGARPCAAARVAAFFPGGLEDLEKLKDLENLKDPDARALDALSDASVIKLKIGRTAAREERAFLSRALAAWPKARFRLDGNRRLDLDACVALVRDLDPRRIEYLEEPLADVGQLLRLSAESGMPVALDELVADPSEEARAERAFLVEQGRSLASGGIGAWVLRMSALGSLEAIRARADEAARLGVDVVLSTAYESSFALRVAVHLAASMPNARRAHGIGTAALLAEDSCAPALPRDGSIAGDPLPPPFAEAWS